MNDTEHANSALELRHRLTAREILRIAQLTFGPGLNARDIADPPSIIQGSNPRSAAEEFYNANPTSSVEFAGNYYAQISTFLDGSVNNMDFFSSINADVHDISVWSAVRAVTYLEEKNLGPWPALQAFILWATGKTSLSEIGPSDKTYTGANSLKQLSQTKVNTQTGIEFKAKIDNWYKTFIKNVRIEQWEKAEKDGYCVSRKTLDEVKARLNKKDKEVKDLQKTTKFMQDDLDRALRRGNTAETARDELAYDNDKFFRENRKLKSGYNTAKIDLHTVYAEHNQLKAQHHSLFTDFGNLNRDHHVLASNFDSLRMAHATLSSNFAKQHAEHSSLTANYRNLSAQNATLQAAYHGLNMQYGQLYESYNQVCHDNVLKANRIEALERENKVIKLELAEVKIENAQNAQKLSAVEDKFAALYKQLEYLGIASPA